MGIPSCLNVGTPSTYLNQLEGWDLEEFFMLINLLLLSLLGLLHPLMISFGFTSSLLCTLAFNHSSHLIHLPPTPLGFRKIFSGLSLIKGLVILYALNPLDDPWISTLSSYKPPQPSHGSLQFSGFNMVKSLTLDKSTLWNIRLLNELVPFELVKEIRKICISPISNPPSLFCSPLLHGTFLLNMHISLSQLL